MKAKLAEEWLGYEAGTAVVLSKNTNNWLIDDSERKIIGHKDAIKPGLIKQIPEVGKDFMIWLGNTSRWLTYNKLYPIIDIDNLLISIFTDDGFIWKFDLVSGQNQNLMRLAGDEDIENWKPKSLFPLAKNEYKRDGWFYDKMLLESLQNEYNTFVKPQEPQYSISLKQIDKLLYFVDKFLLRKSINEIYEEIGINTEKI